MSNNLWHNNCTISLRKLMSLKKDNGGMEMDTDRSCAERMVVENANTGLKKCDSCNRELTSSAEWMCSDHRVICDVCYSNLLAPNKKINFDD